MASGNLRKMTVSQEETIRYDLVLDENIRMNTLVGKVISLNWNGVITCTVCQKNTKKSFGDGFCYACFISAPEATECTIRPELCRAHLGEGRDPEWEERNHNTPHIVYTVFRSNYKSSSDKLEEFGNGTRGYRLSRILATIWCSSI